MKADKVRMRVGSPELFSSRGKRLLPSVTLSPHQHTQKKMPRNEYHLIARHKDDKVQSKMQSYVLASLANKKFNEQVAQCPYAKEIESVGLWMKPVKQK